MSDQPTDPYNVLADLNTAYEAARQWDNSKDRDAAAKASDLLDGVANRLLMVRAQLGAEVWEHDREEMYAADRQRR